MRTKRCFPGRRDRAIYTFRFGNVLTAAARVSSAAEARAQGRQIAESRSARESSPGGGQCANRPEPKLTQAGNSVPPRVRRCEVAAYAGPREIAFSADSSFALFGQVVCGACCEGLYGEPRIG